MNGRSPFRTVARPVVPRAWHALLGAMFLLLLMALQFRPIDDVDVFWQVRLGQLMMETGALVERVMASFI